LVFIPHLMATPFAIGLGVTISSTSVGQTYSVQHSFDYTGSSAFISSNATWFNNTGLTAKIDSADGNYAFPVAAIRVFVSAGSSTATATLTALQAGVG